MTRTSVAAGCLAVVAGCIEFGGPLTNEGDDDTAADSETTATDTDEDLCGPSTAVVQTVIDGDTVILDSGERVRYILVDTPEITGDENQCWGQQASQFNAMLVLQQTVSLAYDVECKDHYGRLLAYVSVGDLEVNRELLETGQACFLHIKPNGNGKSVEYEALEAAAKQAKLGMWGACATIQCD